MNLSFRWVFRFCPRSTFFSWKGWVLTGAMLVLVSHTSILLTGKEWEGTWNVLPCCKLYVDSSKEVIEFLHSLRRAHVLNKERTQDSWPQVLALPWTSSENLGFTLLIYTIRLKSWHQMSYFSLNYTTILDVIQLYVMHLCYLNWNVMTWYTLMVDCIQGKTVEMYVPVGLRITCRTV